VLFGPDLIGALFINSDIANQPSMNADNVLDNAYIAAKQPRP
jgi:hypothetical protein